MVFSLSLEKGVVVVISKKESGFQIPEGFLGWVGGKNGNQDLLLTMTYWGQTAFRDILLDDLFLCPCPTDGLS